MKNVLLLLLVSSLFIACNDNSTSTSTSSSTTAQANNTGAPIVGKNYTLVPINSSIKYTKPPTLTLHDYRNSNLTFQPDNFNLRKHTPDEDEMVIPVGPGQGQHIAVWIDGKLMGRTPVPFIKHNLSDGKHYMTAALIKSYYESLKNPEASITRRLIVRDGEIIGHSAVRPELIMYHQPSGVYKGEDGKRVPFDFYLANVDLKGAYKVLVDINNGKDQFYINGWQSYYIEGLPKGENIIKLYLVYNNGEVVNSPINMVQETFTIEG